MIRITRTQFWVHDQDAALAFYTEKLGMEVRADVTRAAARRRGSSPATSGASSSC